MKKSLVVFILLAALFAFPSFYLASCGGGGGGEPAPLPTNGTGADGVTIFWQHYGAGFGYGSSVRETSDGGFILTGAKAIDYSSAPDIYVLKTDKDGAVRWERTFGGSGQDSGNSIRETSDGGYIIGGCADCGMSGAPGANNFYLLKLDGDGNKVWDRKYPGSSLQGAYTARETTAGGTPDGYVFVGSKGQGIALIKTDLTGSVLWERSFNSNAGWDVGFAVEQTADGGYIIAGDYAASDIWLIKTDADGMKIWDKRLGAGEGFSVAETPDNGFVVAGRTTIRTFVAPPAITPGDAVVIKTDSAGTQVWRSVFGGDEDDEARGITRTLDGGCVLAGKTLSYGPGPVDYNQSWQWEDVFIVKVDANGNPVWQKVKGHRPNSSDGGASVDAVSDGGYIVTGNSNAYPSGNILLMKTDKNGDTVNLGDQDLTLTVTETTGVIKASNAVDVAAAGVVALKTPHDVGAYALGLLVAGVNGDPVSSFCTSGGYAFNPSPASLTAGDEYVLTISNCVETNSAPPQTLNGSATITVNYASGDPGTADYALQVTISQLNITSGETGGSLTSSLTGGMDFNRASSGGAFTESSQSIDSPAEKLTVTETENGVTHTRVLGPFLVRDSVSAAGSYGFGLAGDQSSVTAVYPGANPGIDLVVEVVAPIQGASPGAAPSGGGFTVTAADGSRLTAVITNGIVDLAVDSNGDGVAEGHVSAPWDFFD